MNKIPKLKIFQLMIKLKPDWEWSQLYYGLRLRPGLPLTSPQRVDILHQEVENVHIQGLDINVILKIQKHYCTLKSTTFQQYADVFLYCILAVFMYDLTFVACFKRIFLTYSHHLEDLLKQEIHIGFKNRNKRGLPSLQAKNHDVFYASKR